MIEHRLPPKPIAATAIEAARAAPPSPSPGTGTGAYSGGDGATHRIACILVGDFPLAAAMRQNPGWHGRPAVLVESCGRRALAAGTANLECRLVSAQAAAAGVRAGMTVARARAAAPGLAVINRSSVAEATAAEALIDVACSLSPIVEAGANGEVYLDLGGPGRLRRRRSSNPLRNGAAADTGADEPSMEQPDAETVLAREAMGRAARVGMEAAVGIASSKEVALLAARCGGARVIAPGREKEFLNWLPLDLLKLGGGGREGAELEMTLARWGIRRLGELARLDVRAVGSRLGARAVELVRIARGHSRTPLLARRPADNFAEEVELEWGVENPEAMGFVMRPMIERIVERIAMRGMAVGDITLALELDNHRRDIRRVALPAPTNEVRSLLALMLINLEASPPRAAITAIRITAEPRTPRAAQADMFAPPCPTPERLYVTLARLAALCGPDRVGTLVPRNSHRPGAVRLGPFDPRPAAPAARPAPDGAGAAEAVVKLAIRTIRPPRQVEVLCTRGGSPEFVRGEGFGGRVVSCAGPWRIAGEWWRAAPEGADASAASAGRGMTSPPSTSSADYYDAALEDGGVYRLLRDLRSDEWYVDGIYD